MTWKKTVPWRSYIAFCLTLLIPVDTKLNKWKEKRGLRFWKSPNIAGLLPPWLWKSKFNACILSWVDYILILKGRKMFIHSTIVAKVNEAWKSTGKIIEHKLAMICWLFDLKKAERILYVFICFAVWQQYFSVNNFT